MTEGFDISVSAGDRTVRLVLSGDLDLAAVSDLRAAFSRVATDHAHSEVLVDLTRVTFVDSTIVSVVEHAWHAARERGRALTAANPRGLVKRAFVVAGLADLFTAPPVPATV